jgi:hypothetical protein
MANALKKSVETKASKKASREEYVPPSAVALEMLEAGLKSARESPLVYLGEFSKYAEDE